MSDLIERGGGVIPARLSFLAIYNPSLGKTDETLQDQIVYYYDTKNKPSGESRQSLPNGTSKEDRNLANEKLRQIGLAQGMIEFAKYCDLLEIKRTRD